MLFFSVMFRSLDRFGNTQQPSLPEHLSSSPSTMKIVVVVVVVGTVVVVVVTTDVVVKSIYRFGIVAVM